MSDLKHVAIIMDGNGRWAKERRRPRFWGHIKGSQVVSKIVSTAVERKLEALTLYAFSTENWSRPQEEINVLFKLLEKFLKREREKIVSNNVQFEIIGNIDGLNQRTKQLIKDIQKETKDCTGLKLSLAFSYGGRKEIVDSVNAFIEKNPNVAITEEDIEKNLYRPDSGDVDLLIRTAGDQRISNFLLWQCSYAELYFSQTKWPDFGPQEFVQILDKVSCRERRFGTVSNGVSIEEARQLAKKQREAISHGS
ncbi:MAG: di-trans,poly-cis-decaprenylcistransferase [Halobacteriovoraceae bacterium]|nr:di-trans,poly-cis-decaprenylcistransferase [Halobacteriovoraceae bacterium]|tara:strand:- start:261705 stop:262460 length:756 start_codon:yes stop_codon:yes gene_type:complete